MSAVDKSPHTETAKFPSPLPLAEARKIGLAREATLLEEIPANLRGHFESLPPRYRRRAIESALGQATPRQVMRGKCEECVGFEEAESRISSCTAKRCPLWAYRPYQEKSAET